MDTDTITETSDETFPESQSSDDSTEHAAAIVLPRQEGL